jgi:bifunctional DNA-binding transcriptional regulator/antitoxin component of YhaV-PrlF toxin-antitoxin module
VFAITRRGHIYIPAVVRRRCAISAADRLLIAAEPAERRLVIHPPAAIDAMIASHHGSVLGGDAT